MEIKSLIVEYLIIIKQEDSFCNSDKAFLNFLCVDSSLKISAKQKMLSIDLKKKVQFDVTYTLESDLVPSEKERYFKLTLVSKEVDKINEFSELLALLEKIISKLHPETSINVLWNDVSRLYAIEGYTLINEVENLLRRLIANFMLTKVGFDYPKNHIPVEVESRDPNLKSNYTDYLHQTYFSDLKTILFEGQRDIDFRNIGDIQRLVERHISEGKKEIKIEDMQGVISKSLWEKHFSKDTDYKKNHLEADLESLNKLRNEIAHNRHITRETLGRIQTLSKKIITTLKLELADLNNKKLTSEEQKFQANTENIRIWEGSVALRSNNSEKLVLAWYERTYPIQSITTVGERGIDFLVELDKQRIIAVEAKLMPIGRLKVIRNQIAHGRDIELIIPRNIFEFSEFHLVFVLTDFDENINLNFAKELSNLLTGINPKIKIILGIINDNQDFEVIPV